MVRDDEDELKSDDFTQGHYRLQYKCLRARLCMDNLRCIQPYSDLIGAMLIEENNMEIIGNDMRIK